MEQGIYKIRNIVNNKIYIGSSSNLPLRKRQHFYKLSKNKHCNPHLQSSYNNYGKNNFSFEIIEYLEHSSSLIQREQYWINELFPEYNICLTAGNTLGMKFSEKSKQKMRKFHRNKTLTKEHKQNISKSLIGNKRAKGSGYKQVNQYTKDGILIKKMAKFGSN